MGGDRYVRGVLSLMAVCLLVGVAAQLGFLGGEMPAPEQDRRGPFVVQAIRMSEGLALLRTDTVSGEVWRFNLKEGEDWERIGAAPGASSAAEPGPAVAAPHLPAPGSSSAEETLEARSLADAVTGDRSPDIRAWAAEQLAYVDPSESLAALTTALGDPEPKVVLAAINSLRTAGDARAAAPLRALLAHPDPELRSAAASALEALPR